MGRRKSYDRDELVAKAMELFRDNGFDGTSAEMLSEQLGVNRFSIYSEFGSKQALFEEALQRYDSEVVGRSFEPLEKPSAGLDTIRELFGFYGTAGNGAALGRGCLLCNTAVEFGPEDPGNPGFVKRYFKRISKAFENALQNAINQGELSASVDHVKEASLLTASVLGLFVMIRAKASRTMIKNASVAALKHVDSLRSNSDKKRSGQ